MSTSHIVSLLIEERSRLEAAIAALQGSPEPVHHGPPARPMVKAPTAPKRKAISAEARRRMAEGQKRRYAAIRAPKAEATAPKVSKKLADVIAPPEDVEFKAKMSEAMKVSWAKRKKAAASAAAKPNATAAKGRLPVKKGGLTEAGRKALSPAMKKRWAAKKKAAEKKAA